MWDVCAMWIFLLYLENLQKGFGVHVVFVVYYISVTCMCVMDGWNEEDVTQLFVASLSNLEQQIQIRLSFLVFK